MQVTKSKVEYTEHTVELDVGQVKQILADHIKSAKNLDAKPEDIAFDIDFGHPTEHGFEEVTGVTATILKRGKVQKNGHVPAKVVNRPTPMIVQPMEVADDGFPEDAHAKKAKPKTAKEEKPKPSAASKVQADAEKQAGTKKAKASDKTPKKAKKSIVPDEPDED